jgi:hypothetical protein
MQTYTVVAVYPDNMQRFCEWVEADDPQDAEEMIEEKYDVWVAGIFEGKLTPVDKDPLYA